MCSCFKIYRFFFSPCSINLFCQNKWYLEYYQANRTSNKSCLELKAQYVNKWSCYKIINVVWDRVGRRAVNLNYSNRSLQTISEEGFCFLFLSLLVILSSFKKNQWNITVGNLLYEFLMLYKYCLAPSHVVSILVCWVGSVICGKEDSVVSWWLLREPLRSYNFLQILTTVKTSITISIKLSAAI